MSLDIKKLKLAIRALAEEIRTKYRPRVRVALPTMQDRENLYYAKRDMTLMCILRAQHRNKVHLAGKTLEEQAEYLKYDPNLVRYYQKKEEPKV